MLADPAGPCWILEKGFSCKEQTWGCLPLPSDCHDIPAPPAHSVPWAPLSHGALGNSKPTLHCADGHVIPGRSGESWGHRAGQCQGWGCAHLHLAQGWHLALQLSLMMLGWTHQRRQVLSPHCRPHPEPLPAPVLTPPHPTPPLAPATRNFLQFLQLTRLPLASRPLLMLFLCLERHFPSLFPGQLVPLPPLPAQTVDAASSKKCSLSSPP